MVPNCEGLVTFKLQAVNRLHEFIQLEAPSLVFLMETGLKKKNHEFQKVDERMGFKNCLVVDCEREGNRRNGGLALLSVHYIDTDVFPTPLLQFIPTCFYSISKGKILRIQRQIQPYSLNCL
jgi:hypothetical protein